MKVQTLVLEDDNEIYVDCYLDERMINGYYWTKDNIEDDSINVFFGVQTLTIKQSLEVMEYLIKQDWH